MGAIMNNKMKKKLVLVISSVFVLFFTFSVFAAPKFYPDDPLAVEPETQDASGVESWKINLIYDVVENLFTKPGDKTPDVRAQNTNTIDEVPDSNWYINRKDLTPEMVSKGQNESDGPAPGKWIVVASKSDGVSPGFTIKDSNDVRWFIKFDPPGYPTMATGTEVAVSKLFWALGFYVPEYHISKLDPAQLEIAEGTNFELPSGKKRHMKSGDIDTLLRLAEKEPDGSYRIIASRALDGKILGGFRHYGTRPDDPNDLVPHEHRRELRGYRVFSAWLNHVDSKSIQSLDVLMDIDGKKLVRHHLLDFSSALGSGSVRAREPWEGYEYLYEGHGNIAKNIVSGGFRIAPWRTVDLYESDTVGKMTFDNTQWDPEAWVPRIPSASFQRARPDDKFWAARKVMGISDDMIRAAIKSGQFGDSEGEEFLITALIQRRNTIGRTYLPAVNPVVDPALSNDGTLTFANAAVDAGFAKSPANYTVTWHRFDNSSGTATRIGSSGNSATQVKAPASLPTDDGTYIQVDINAQDPTYPTWEQPVHAYFHRTGGAWKLVGFERMAEVAQQTASQ
jgi:hypothetical protein